jgi:protein gp37
MAEQTNITWTQHTWNPWWGCRKISPGCRECYMYAMLRRFGRDPAAVQRTKTLDAPRKWEKVAAAQGRSEMVFTCSLSDWFIEEADAWRSEAWRVVRECPHLIFQILTKRPQLIPDRLPPDWGEGYQNVWLGVSVENAEYLHRVDLLRAIPARVRFISAEPLLGPLTGLNLSGVHWLIAGGESGPHFRPMDLAWARDLRDRCVAEKVAFFFKQSSNRLPGRGEELDDREWKQLPVSSQ